MSSETPNRRDFVKTASATAAGVTTFAGALEQAVARAAHNSVNETLKIGLIGCGGRGKGAAVNATHADPDVKITALADAFTDRIDSCREQLEIEIGDYMDVDDDHCFTGFDCHEKLVETDVDVVLLCSPPYFRPMQMEAAVAAGKHIFCEKPIATDAPGVRRVMAASDLCKVNGLSLVSGLCWRYDLGVVATMNQINDGAIGDIKAMEANYLTGELWHRGNKPEWSQMEYQLRNWLYFNWLAGDLINEQHIHTLDKCLWLMGDEPPVRCYGTGGRQKRTDPMYGTTYDHFTTVYEWANGIKAFSHCRQMSGCWSENECHVFGTDGTAHILDNRIETADDSWRYRGPSRSMYDVEHDFLFKSIRDNDPINNGDYMCKSTLMALMGRQASYTGQEIAWDEILADDTVLGPDVLAWGDYDVGPVPVPGRV
ncbi:MAG: Gfo/Idh/MocA family protein [Pirellulaceae bacterium]